MPWVQKGTSFEYREASFEGGFVVWTFLFDLVLLWQHHEWFILQARIENPKSRRLEPSTTYLLQKYYKCIF